MAALLALDLSGLAELLQQTRQTVAELTFEEPLRLVAIYLGAETKRNFDESRTPDGSPWAPLKRRRRRNEHSPQPLRNTGLLMAAASAVAASQAVREVRSHSLIFGAAVDYGGYHQDGTKFLPRRQWLGLTERMADRTADIVVDWVVRRLSRE